ncbi:MAG: hypothetical protein H0W64_02745 [Gammaproteobacteria bacterium]|nr:hypothetical protein [Gammaproteobacteria bacterium]
MLSNNNNVPNGSNPVKDMFLAAEKELLGDLHQDETISEAQKVQILREYLNGIGPSDTWFSELETLIINSSEKNRNEIIKLYVQAINIYSELLNARMATLFVNIENEQHAQSDLELIALFQIMLEAYHGKTLDEIKHFAVIDLFQLLPEKNKMLFSKKNIPRSATQKEIIQILQITCDPLLNAEEKFRRSIKALLASSLYQGHFLPDSPKENSIELEQLQLILSARREGTLTLDTMACYSHPTFLQLTQQFIEDKLIPKNENLSDYSQTDLQILLFNLLDDKTPQRYAKVTASFNKLIPTALTDEVLLCCNQDDPALLVKLIEEIVILILRKKQLKKMNATSPSFQKTTDYYNDLIQFATVNILSEPHLNKRLLILNRWAMVLDHCYKNKNYFGAITLLNVFNSNCLIPLFGSNYNCLHEKSCASLEEINETLSPTQNFKNYHQRISADTHYIPLINLLSRDFIFSKENQEINVELLFVRDSKKIYDIQQKAAARYNLNTPPNVMRSLNELIMERTIIKVKAAPKKEITHYDASDLDMYVEEVRGKALDSKGNEVKLHFRTVEESQEYNQIAKIMDVVYAQAKQYSNQKKKSSSVNRNLQSSASGPATSPLRPTLPPVVVERTLSMKKFNADTSTRDDMLESLPRANQPTLSRTASARQNGSLSRATSQSKMNATGVNLETLKSDAEDYSKDLQRKPSKIRFSGNFDKPNTKQGGDLILLSDNNNNNSKPVDLMQKEVKKNKSLFSWFRSKPKDQKNHSHLQKSKSKDVDGPDNFKLFVRSGSTLTSSTFQDSHAEKKLRSSSSFRNPGKTEANSP